MIVSEKRMKQENIKSALRAMVSAFRTTTALMSQEWSIVNSRLPR